MTEKCERRLFELDGLHRPGTNDASNKSRSQYSTGPYHWQQTPEVYRLCNLVSDCGLVPDYSPPDCCLSNNYAPGVAFKSHVRLATFDSSTLLVVLTSVTFHLSKYDSRHRWGETVVGVSLGRASTIYFHPDPRRKDKHIWRAGPPRKNFPKDYGVDIKVRDGYASGYFRIDVVLPRGSIYVMSGDARTEWMHGIESNPKNSKRTEDMPSWNPHGLRRSLTLRSDKIFSDIYLERLVEQNPNDGSARARLKAQMAHYSTLRPDGKRGTAEEVQQWRAFAVGLHEFLKTQPTNSRFGPDMITFSLPPDAAREAAAIQRTGFAIDSGVGRRLGGGGHSSPGEAALARLLGNSQPQKGRSLVDLSKSEGDIITSKSKSAAPETSPSGYGKRLGERDDCFPGDAAPARLGKRSRVIEPSKARAVVDLTLSDED